MRDASPRIADPTSLLGSQPSDTSLARCLGITKVVYSLVYPETRSTLDQLWDSHPHVLFDQAYLDVQDGAEDVFVQRWADWAAPATGDLSSFGHRYATSGSSEAIRESIWMLVAQSDRRASAPRIHVFDGEYEGYAAYAAAAGVQTIVHDRRTWRDTLRNHVRAGDRWYMSHPSAIDGMIWPEFDEWLRELEKVAPERRVMLDLTYVGAAPAPLRVNASHPLVHTVFFSLSKIFGVYYHRVGGCLSREQMPGLYGNRWFKNMFSLYLGCALMQRVGLFDLPQRYGQLQQEACAIVSERLGASGLLRPSDALMLAHVDDQSQHALPAELAPLRRGHGHRVCLTPLMTELLSAPSGRGHQP